MNKVWELVKKFLKEYYFYLLIVVFSLVFTKQIINTNGIGGFWIIALIEVIIEVVVFFVLYKMRKKSVPIEKQFLFVGILLGILFILVLPPGQSPDEQNHFRRAYGIAQGEIVASNRIDEKGSIGSKLPIEVYNIKPSPSSGTYERIGKELIEDDSGEISEQAYTNTALYNFICYLPQTLAALIGKILGFSIVGIAYLMKIFNFVMWMILIYFAIKLIPKFKAIVLFIALLPITLQEATSMAPDALTIGLAIFLISYVLYWSYEKTAKKMKKRDLIILYTAAIIIGFCKIVYFPLVLMYLMIPKERFGGKKQKWIHLGIIFGVTIILNVLWLVISSGFLVEFNPGVDSKAQIFYILTHPHRYIMTIFETINMYGELWLNNMLGTFIGAFSFRLPNVLFFVSFIIFIILFAQRDELLKVKKFDRIIIWGVFAVIMLLIFTSLYIQWTPVGFELVDGVQGRYFLPILLLIPMMICKKDTKKVSKTIISEKTVLNYGLFINIIACVTVLAQNI